MQLPNAARAPRSNSSNNTRALPMARVRDRARATSSTMSSRWHVVARTARGICSGRRRQRARRKTNGSARGASPWVIPVNGASPQRFMRAHQGKNMKRLVAIISLIGSVISVGAQAQTYGNSTTQRNGSQSNTTFGDGTSSTTQRIGNQSYTTFSDGTTATTQRIGSQAYTTDSNGNSATTQRIGNQSYTTDSNGNSATTQRIGSQSYTTDSKGRSTTCQTIGAQTFCN